MLIDVRRRCKNQSSTCPPPQGALSYVPLCWDSSDSGRLFLNGSYSRTIGYRTTVTFPSECFALVPPPVLSPGALGLLSFSRSFCPTASANAICETDGCSLSMTVRGCRSTIRSRSIQAPHVTLFCGMIRLFPCSCVCSDETYPICYPPLAAGDGGRVRRCSRCLRQLISADRTCRSGRARELDRPWRVNGRPATGAGIARESAKGDGAGESASPSSSPASFAVAKRKRRFASRSILSLAREFSRR